MGLKIGPLSALLLWIFALTPRVQASLVEVAQQNMPPCAFSCLATAVVHSTCGVEDLACICANTQLNDQAAACIIASCTIKESLTAKNFSSTQCQEPVRDHTGIVAWTGMFGWVLAVVAVGLRLVQRHPRFGGGFGWDDTFIIASTIVATPLSLLALVLAHDGLGKDIWTVPFDKITEILYAYYFDEMMYTASLSLTKISILFLYMRLFKTRGFKICNYILLGFNTANLIAYVLALLFQCSPINLAWKHWDGEHPGKCLNVNAIGWSATSVNIALDLAMIILPLPQLAKLDLDWSKKVPLFALFMLGLFVTIISCLRVRYMVKFANSVNPTWDYVPVGYWSLIEVHLSIVIACAPSLRALMVRFLSFARPSRVHDQPTGSSGRRSKPSIGTRTSGLSYGDDKRRSRFQPLEDHNDGRYTPDWAAPNEVEMGRVGQWNATKPLSAVTATEHPWDFETQNRPR